MGPAAVDTALVAVATADTFPAQEFHLLTGLCGVGL
jgi:hypothetical protein